MTQLTGKSYAVMDGSGHQIHIYNQRGEVQSDGWYSNSIARKHLRLISSEQPIVKMTVTPTIRRYLVIRYLVERHFKSSDNSKVAVLTVSSRVAVQLYLEGVLKFKHFEHADEDTDDAFIVLPSVEIAHHKLKVRIFNSDDETKPAVTDDESLQ